MTGATPEKQARSWAVAKRVRCVPRKASKLDMETSGEKLRKTQMLAEVKQAGYNPSEGLIVESSATTLSEHSLSRRSARQSAKVC